MNLADSVKKVLKSKSQNIFSDFWKDDLKTIIMDIAHDVTRMGKATGRSFKNIKKLGVKTSFKEMLDSGADTLLIFKVLPGRVKAGFLKFKEEFIQELEIQPDQKQKAIFSLKVIGALTSFALGTIYSVKKGKTDFTLKGLKRRNAFTQFIVAELVFRISQVFIHRFLSELEKEVSDPEDLKNIRYFKELIAGRSQVENEDNSENEIIVTSDRSIEMVEALKQFIMTGK
jgi:hypothetical protein